MEEGKFQDVEDLAMHLILKSIGPNDTARVGCVNKRFRDLASDDSLWSIFCAQDLHLSSPLDPLSNPLPTFKGAYKSWRDSFIAYPWPLVLRVKSCWDRLKNWMAVYLPEAANSLQSGASESDIADFENFMKIKLPLPTRLLYRFVNGQNLPQKSSRSSKSLFPCGLIGGYSFYEHRIDVYLLSLQAISLRTERINRRLGLPERIGKIVVATSCTSSEKYFFLGCEEKQLYVGTRNLLIDGEMVPCVPPSLISNNQDALLLWLEEHCRRLESNAISVRKHRNTKTICHFPESPPLCSTAITCGVKVRASAVFVPELSDLQNDADKQWFSYSVRMSLSEEGCAVGGARFKTCQLYWRRWVIRSDDEIVSEVSAEAVIGEYPLLSSEGTEFVYQSCAALPASPGSIEGAFTFVPGRLSNAGGDQFEVDVARFPLQLPDYIY